MRVREPALFGRENVITVIILLRDLETQRMSWSDGSYRLEVLTSFNKNSRTNFSGKKKYIETYWGVNFFFLRKTKKLKLNLILIVVRKSCPS